MNEFSTYVKNVLPGDILAGATVKHSQSSIESNVLWFLEFHGTPFGGNADCIHLYGNDIVTVWREEPPQHAALREEAGKRGLDADAVIATVEAAGLL